MAQTPAEFSHKGDTIDYTPSGSVLAGTVVVVGLVAGITRTDLAANEKGALAVDGVFKVPKVTGAIGSCVAVYWDADGDPLGGTSGSGCATTTSSGNTLMGKTAAAATETDQYAYVRLSY